MNYQAWLAAQGLTVQHGIVPEDNLTDNAMDAWHDTFSTSEDSSDDSALILVPLSAPVFQQHTEPESVTISVALHQNGIQFGLSVEGSDLINLLLHDPIPCNSSTPTYFMLFAP